MKRILPILIAIILIAFVIYQLRSNKEKLEAQTDLSLRKVEEIPVRVFTVSPWAEAIRETFSGQLVAESELMVTSSAQGRITRVYVEKGQQIKQGDVIAQVEDALLREQVQVTQSAYDKLKKDQERFRIMAENEAVTGQQLETLELNLKAAEAKYLAAQQQLSDNRVKSPISGTVNQLFVKKGAMLGPGVPVCEIVNTDNLLLRLKLSRNELEQISSSEQVEVRIDGVPELATGRVSFQSVKPDYANLFEVDIVLNRHEGELRPGMMASAISESMPPSDEIFIPQQALLGYGESEFYVFVVSEGRAVRRTVSAGDTKNGRIHIIKGLSAGDRVITEGQNMIDAGQKIAVQE